MTGAELWEWIPAHLRPGLLRYLRQGVRPGGFLAAVLGNDLMAAVAHGDPAGLAALADLVRWLVVCAPGRAWGTPGAVAAWCVDGDDWWRDRRVVLAESAARDSGFELPKLEEGIPPRSEILQSGTAREE